ncbi:thioredoxin family protein, partial [Agromyces seonyuensis]
AAAALVAVATAIGLVGRARAGRARAVRGAAGHEPHRETLHALRLSDDDLGEAATLVQFTSEFCAQCGGAARRLDQVAGDYAGVRRVEVDLTDAPEIAAHFRVLQTPTTLILDAAGTPVARIGGLPRAEAVRAHLDRLSGSPHVAA